MSNMNKPEKNCAELKKPACKEDIYDSIRRNS